MHPTRPPRIAFAPLANFFNRHPSSRWLQPSGRGGVEAIRGLLATATRDVAALQLAYRTRTATGAISGSNPFTGALEHSRSTASSSSAERSTGSASASALGAGSRRQAPEMDEVVLWIYENLRFRLHQVPRVHDTLLAIAIKAGYRLGAMHREHHFVRDYKVLLEERCAQLPHLRFSSIPVGRLVGAAPLAALQDAVARLVDVGYWKVLIRHLLNLT